VPADGHSVAPLDDAYITFQYARQIAKGSPFQYNDGDPPTTGMTSLLYGFLLAGAHRIGFTGEHLVTFALGMGIIWLGLIGWLTYRIASHLIDREGWNRRWALAAMVLVLLTGSVQWSCFNGMETGFFTVLTLAALNAFLADRMSLCALWLALAGLTRTEGLILAGLTWAVIFSRKLMGKRTVRWKHLVPISLAVLVGFLPSIVNYILTGTSSAAGLRAKSWLLNVPFYPKDIARSILLDYRQIILERFLGWQPSQSWFVPPGILLLSALGWTWLGRRLRWNTLALTLSWFLLGTLSTATLITATWHLGRYQVPFVPVVIILAVYGLAALKEWSGQRWQQILLGALGLFLLFASFYSTFHFARLYHRAVYTLVHQQLALGNWVDKNLPEGIRVGVHDTGAIRYYGQRPTYDLIGLTTPDAAIAWRHAAGSVFEKMEHSPIRPDYFAIYPDVFSIPYLADTDLFDEELFHTKVPNYAVTSASPVQGVWRADWHLAGSGDIFYQPDIITHTTGLEVVDRLDVANLDDEAAHNVEWWQGPRRSGFPTEVWQLTYQVLPEQEALDGGRLLTGGIAFDVHTQPDEPLWIVARLHAKEAGAVQVEVDGRAVGHWEFPPVPGHWLETHFRVPADRITSPSTRVTLRVDADNPKFQHYGLYYLWFLQGKVEATTMTIGHQVDVTFAENLSLEGFDLPANVWHPGDIVPVTLYWQAEALSHSDAKAFLHVYNADGQLISQIDGWAYRQTRPPYTWWPDEIVRDPRYLALPTDLPPGDYSLDVGLYESSGRLPAYLNGIRQPEDRVPLAMIEVTN
jgi:hypothetical protein